MANERMWDAVPPVLLTADGTTEGVLQVVDTAGFFFDMQCTLKNNTPSQLTVYIKRVVNSTTLWVGPKKGGLDHNVDVSTFTVATASNISAAMQDKSTVPMEARLQATYETDPIDAWRVRPVDPYGNGYSNSNPLPVAFDGTVSIGDVHILGPSPANNELNVNADGSINTNSVVSGSVTVSGTVNTNLNGLNAFETAQYQVGVGAIQITVPTGTSSINIKVRTTTSNDAVILGNSNSVTNTIDGTGNGYALFNGDAIQIDLTPTAEIWLIGTSIGQIAYVVEAGS